MGPPSRALHTTGLPPVPRQRLPEQDLSDVVQEVFKAVSLNINRFRRDRPGDTFRGCLRTISRSKVNDCFRKKGKEATAAGGSEAHGDLPADY